MAGKLLNFRRIADWLRSIARSSGSPHDSGFALLMVMIMLGLLSAIAATFVLTVSTDVRTIKNLIHEARSQVAADAGVKLAAAELDLLRTGGRSRISPDGQQFVCQLRDEDLSIRIAVHDEGGKVDLNTASEELLLAFFRGLGSRSPSPEQIVDRLLDFRDSDDRPRDYGAEADDYAAAGRSYGPKNRPLGSIEELDQVLGMPEDLFRASMSHVTVHSGQIGVDPSVAEPELLAVLRSGARGAPGLSGLPPDLVTTSLKTAFRVYSTAILSGGFRSERDAVIVFGDRPDHAIELHRWMKAMAPEDKIRPSTRGSLPDC